MKNKSKLTILILLAVTAAVFTGCSELKIESSISADNLVTHMYELSISGVEDTDVNYKEIREFLHKVSDNWKEAGFDSKVIIKDDLILVRGTLTKQCSSREEAFITLYEFMTSPASPFSNVEYGYNLNYYYEDYFLKASLDFSDIVDNDIYTAYPSIVGEDVDKFFENFKCTVNFSLPENNSLETDEISQNILVKDITPNGENEIVLSGRINNNANAQYEKDLIAKREKEEKNLIVFTSAGLFAIIVLIILIILRKRKKKSYTVTETEKDLINPDTIINDK